MIYGVEYLAKVFIQARAFYSPAAPSGRGGYTYVYVPSNALGNEHSRR